MYLFIFFNNTPTTEIYTLSLHDPLPISGRLVLPTGHPPWGDSVRRGEIQYAVGSRRTTRVEPPSMEGGSTGHEGRSEEHTSELQSRQYLVCRLLLEKKKN